VAGNTSHNKKDGSYLCISLFCFGPSYSFYLYIYQGFCRIPSHKRECTIGFGRIGMAKMWGKTTLFTIIEKEYNIGASG
jgi:hypothetical protein